MLNPVLSVGEDALAIAGLALAFVAPVAVAIAALLLTLAFMVVVRRVFRRRASTPVA